MTEETRRRIAELEEKESEIAYEIYLLRNKEKGYYIGIGDNDESFSYHQLGFCTEEEAQKQMEEIGDFLYGFEVQEVTEDYYNKIFTVKRMQTLVSILANKEFDEYKDTYKDIRDKLRKLKDEMHIAGAVSIR